MYSFVQLHLAYRIHTNTVPFRTASYIYRRIANGQGMHGGHSASFASRHGRPSAPSTPSARQRWGFVAPIQTATQCTTDPRPLIRHAKWLHTRERLGWMELKRRPFPHHKLFLAACRACKEMCPVRAAEEECRPYTPLSAVRGPSVLIWLSMHTEYLYGVLYFVYTSAH